MTKYRKNIIIWWTRNCQIWPWHIKIKDLISLKEGVNMKPKKMKKDYEELWAKNKYYVLSKSQKVYLEIR